MNQCKRSELRDVATFLPQGYTVNSLGRDLQNEAIYQNSKDLGPLVSERKII